MTHTPTSNGSSSARTRRTSRTTSSNSTPALTTGSPTSLYHLGLQAQEISGEIALALELIDSEDIEERETGEALIQQYFAAKGEVETKADNYCFVIQNVLRDRARFRKEQAKREYERLVSLAESDERKADRMERLLIDVLTKLDPGQSRFDLPRYRISSRSSTSVEITDEDLIPEDMLRAKTTTAPDKTLIKQAIQSGQDIPGAQLKTNTNWTIK